MTACLNRAWTALQRAGTLATQPCTHEHLIPFGTVPHILAFVIDARLQFWKNGFQHQWVDAWECSFYHDSNLRDGIAVPIPNELCHDDALFQQRYEVLCGGTTLHGLGCACDIHGPVVLTDDATDELHEDQPVPWGQCLPVVLAVLLKYVAHTVELVSQQRSALLLEAREQVEHSDG